MFAPARRRVPGLPAGETEEPVLPAGSAVDRSQEDTRELPVREADRAEPNGGHRRPRSAAAEEFLQETPEFSLSRSRGHSRTSKARAYEERTPSKPKARKVRERPRQDDHQEQTLGQWFREVTILGLIAVSSALFLTTYVVQAFFIPSESMEDTLQINDRVLVNKLAYRFGDPAGGDLVVFAAESEQVAEQEPETAFARGFDTVATALGLKSSAKDLIKRVIAVEGQTVEIRVGLLYVDGQELTDESYRKDFEAMEDYGPVTVPPDHVFVMGDNRQNSSDSRTFGPIPESSLVGKAFARIWPVERFQWLNT